MRIMVLAAAALALAPPASAQSGPGPRGAGGGYANPSAVIAAEIAFGRLAREQGEDAAIRATAADNAIAFVPGRMLVRDQLKQRARADAATVPAVLQTAEVWSSCDGSYAIARGSWRRGGSGDGSFVTLWQRQPKGGYKWLLDLRSTVTPPSADTADMIAGNVAPCGTSPGDRQRGGFSDRPRSRKPKIMQPGIDPASGRSDDGTLRWTATLDASGAGSFVATTAGVTSREVMRTALVPVAPGV